MSSLSNAEKRFLNELIRKVKLPLNLAWGLTVLSTLVLIAQAYLLANIFSHWLNNYFNYAPLMKDVSSTWFIALIVCFITRPLLNMARELISMRASLSVRSELRQTLLGVMAILAPNLCYFGSNGAISSQVIDQTDALDGFISHFSVQKKVAASTPLLILIAVAWQSIFSAGLLLLTAPLVPIFMIIIGHLTAKKSAEQFSALAQLSGRFLDWVRGMPTLKRLQAVDTAYQDLSVSSEAYRYRTMDVLKIAFLNGAVLELLSALSIALVAVYLGFGLMGILPWAKGVIPVDYFGALFILLLAPEFYLPLRQLGADYHAKAQAEGAVRSLLPLIKTAEEFGAQKPSITHSKNQSVVNINLNDNNESSLSDCTHACDHSLDLSKPFGIQANQLSIKSVVPTAQDAENVESEPIHVRTRLHPVSFNIQAGQRVALIGESGAGKSSLLQALIGFVNFDGELLLLSADGKKHLSYADLNLNNLRQHVGYLAQQVPLMPLSIADNLRLSNPNATDEMLINVLNTVELWEVIKRLPNGIHTPLGERGKGLSGGQQQRMGIAQLLLREYSVWLLDEPTEHLDPDTAQTIHDLLEKISRGKTVIWVTHHYTTLDWLDDVIKLEIP